MVAYQDSHLLVQATRHTFFKGEPQARYHQLVEEAYTMLGLVETKVDELRTGLEYQHKRLDEIWDTALADKKE